MERLRMEENMKKLLTFLKDYKKETVLAPLFKLLEAAFELFVPLVIAQIIDVGIPAGDTMHIGKMFGWLLLLAVIGLTCSVTAQFFAAKAATGFATRLRSALFSHIQGLSFTQVDKIGTSTMITRMTSDINQVQSGVNMVLRLFLRSPIIVFGATIMAFTIDVKAALVFVVTIPLLVVVVFGVMVISIPLHKKVQASLDKVLGLTRENLTGVRVIRAFNKEADEIQAFEEQNQVLSGMQNFVGKITACLNPVTYVLVNAAIVALIYIGAIQVDSGNLTQGQVVALWNYMSQILVELVKLANLIVTMTKAVACGDRVWAVLAEEADEPEAFGKPEEATGETAQETGEETAKEAAPEGQLPYLVFEHVGLTYAGAGAETLSDISFQVKKGDTIGIIGGTGSGKTSLVHLLPRFYENTEGNIFLEGKNLKAYSLDEIRKKVGIVMQKAVLFKGTIRSNLLWGKEDATEAEMWEALSIAQAKEIVEGKEGRLDAEVAQNGKNFSGGQKQRLTIARALIKKPEILILDDSASALDYATDAALRKAIREMEGDTTVFIVSQRASSIQYANLIIVLDDGEAVGIGTHEELLATCEVYQEIYYSQFEKKQA